MIKKKKKLTVTVNILWNNKWGEKYNHNTNKFENFSHIFPLYM